METARYFIAVALTAVLLPIILFWIIIHASAIYCPRCKGALVYGIALMVFLAAMAGIAIQYEVLFRTDWGTQPLLIALGILLLAFALWLRILIGRTFTTRQLVGLPEIKSEKPSSTDELVTSGIYSRVRHPRYVQLVIASLGYAIMANYPASYMAVALFVPGICFVVLLEEIELRRRFGATYDEYASRVPRFIPASQKTPKD